ncbi:tyrosine-type recombinase/integrase [Burkholderia cepacia]|uniref:tyrosine-type recombinase/integrase n=1 Tax=Burkholderia cepacia TaxID=292 RepID=UPI002AB6FC9E|nr:tyrosine-type recombinase/integrase [Burkholderia cepacia]
MSPLKTQLQAYLAMRRDTGFKLRNHEPQLRRFLEFMEDRKAPYITQKLAVEWAALPVGKSPSWYSIRLTMVRGFANYLRSKDPRTEHIAVDLLPFRPRRPQPYLYTQSEIQQLMGAALALRSGNTMRPWTYYSLIGLLATTGIRVTEARDLKRGDVDLETGILTIRDAKFGRTRLVPIHPTTQEVLQKYAARRDAGIKANRTCPYFFVGEQGRQLARYTVQTVFADLTRQIGIRSADACSGPRLHDLRHSYAVQILIDAYRAGVDTELMIPVLSTFLGHSQVRCTYWYLTACPELMEQAAERLQTRWENQT